MNGPAVFLSYTWTDEEAVDVIEQALRSRGLTVFRDKDTHLFDGVTDYVRRALDSSVVMLVFYSRRYPVRFACQWELTRAFLSARRLGNSCDRLLIVNPESDDLHIVPSALTDTRCFSWVRESDAARLADAVAGKVEQAVGGLGGVPDGRRAEFRGRLLGPRRFSGRYPEMWSVHTEMHGARRGGAGRPGSSAAVVVEAPAGMGKTVLAEQYSLVFRDAYPGGVVWTSMAGVDQVAGHFAVVVSEVARERFGLDLSGIRPQQAKATLAERITSDVLWVIDDVPDGLDPLTLNDLLVPSPKVHTLLTMRTVPPQWPGGQVTLAGLTTVEAEELLRAKGTPALTQAIDGAGYSLVDSLIDVIRARSPHAQALLGFASVLARVPISGEMLVCGVSGLLGQQAATLVVEALEELDEYGLLNRVAVTARQFWRLNALVATAVRQDLDPVLMTSFAERAARILAHELGEASPDVCTHALELASNASVPLPVRRSLLRAVATRHEERGDIPAARDARHHALEIMREEWQIEDAEAAARLALAAGEARDALRHTGMLIDRARAGRDVRSEFQARLIAATAHDILGDYTKANDMFHDHALVREHGPAPVWLSEADRERAGLARVRALWLRGDFRAARKVVDGFLPAIEQAHPHGTHKGAWPIATINLARLQMSAGQVTEGRATAQRVLSAFTDAGVARHPLAREAVAVLAEGELTMALSVARGKPDRWIHATAWIRQALDESTGWYGMSSPFTLELLVLHGRTLVSSGKHGEALKVLAEAERRTALVLGAEHPLALRARQWGGLATMGRRDWKAATAVFQQLLPRQDAVLGRGHPESQLTRFQLGTCLLKQHNLKRARPLLSEATPVVREHHSPLRQWSTMSVVGRALTRVPRPMMRIINFLEEDGAKQ